MSDHRAHLGNLFDLLGRIQKDALLDLGHSTEVFSDNGGDADHSAEFRGQIDGASLLSDFK